MQTSYNTLWFFMKLLLVGLVVASIVAAILVHTSASGLVEFNSIFQIIP